MSEKNKVIEVLTEVIASMKMEAEYQGLYNAYLLGQMGEGEFLELAEDIETKYDVHVFQKGIETSDSSTRFKQELDDNDKEKIDILFQYTQTQYTPTEIGDLFFLDDKAVEEYLEEKAYEK